MHSKTALIFGITGQDGAYLAELLLEKGYTVHGAIRRSSSFNTGRIDHLYRDTHEKNVNFFLHYSDLTDSNAINSLIHKILPDEIYNLGAQSQVKVSFEVPEYTANTVAIGVLRILEAIKSVYHLKKIKFYQASSAEMFGESQGETQNEQSSFRPRSPYSVSKLFAYWITKNYRESYGIFACNGILFNHESALRGEEFVSRKITKAIANIAYNKQNCLYVGNIDVKRDWGHAKDYVESMWLTLQQPQSDDYVIATGETHSIREFIELAFSEVGFKIAWCGKGIDEVGYDVCTGRELVKIDSKYFRPTETSLLVGDPAYARNKLGWYPKINFVELVKMMLKSDIQALKINNLGDPSEKNDN